MITTQLMREFLGEYDYKVTETGLNVILNIWKRNKADLLEHFRKHPNWDEDNLAIVFKEEQYERPFEKSAIINFNLWVNQQIDTIIKEKGIQIKDLESENRKIRTILDCEQEIRKNVQDLDYLFKNIVINENVTEYKDILRKIENEIDEVKKYRYQIYRNYTEYYMDKDIYDKIQCVQRGMNFIEDNCRSQFITDNEAERITAITGVKVSKGLKLTKAIQKVCMLLDLNKIEDWGYRNDNQDNEKKNYGWNYQYQLLADQINPTRYKRITVISLNPLDYWGMSFGYKWASCHTIDKENKRNIQNNHYEGCYSSGTESYMLDSSSVIFYVIKEDYEGNTYWNEDKMQRVVFCMNEKKDLILESRVYPDGRDGGDDSLVAQFRAVMQKVISETYDLNNYWTVKKGYSECINKTISNGTHYRDYNKYNDCNISYNKDSNGYERIKIGHNPICPCCGNEHDAENNIMCKRCRDENELYCEQCGDTYSEYDGIEINYKGETYYFCCETCAHDAGWEIDADYGDWYPIDELYFCEDDNEYHTEDKCYIDEYNGMYYSGSPYIETSDGYTYSSEDNAEADGYRYEYFSDEWMPADELMYDEYENEYFDPKNNTVITTEDGNIFMTRDSAENAGYVKTVSGSWMDENECRYDSSYALWFTEDEAEVICEDGKFFYKKESAEEEGYTEINGKWRL